MCTSHLLKYLCKEESCFQFRVEEVIVKLFWSVRLSIVTYRHLPTHSLISIAYVASPPTWGSNHRNEKVRCALQLDWGKKWKKNRITLLVWLNKITCLTRFRPAYNCCIVILVRVERLCKHNQGIKSKYYTLARTHVLNSGKAKYIDLQLHNYTQEQHDGNLFKTRRKSG